MAVLIDLLGKLLTIYIVCVFAWALLSWIPMISPKLAFNEHVMMVRRFLNSVVEPYIRLFRFIPPINLGGAMLDLSALVAILVLAYGGGFVLNLIASAVGV